MIWLTSDLHLGHDRQFLYGPRGFDNCAEMNECVLQRLKDCVAPDDDLYILGDLTLGPHAQGIAMVAQIPGRVHIILGNHDTPARVELYKQLPNVVEIALAARFKYKKYYFYLSHYPTITYNLDGADNLKTVCINLHGHTHSKSRFYNDIPYIYNVALDAHGCYPITIDNVLRDIKDEWQLCKLMADPDVEDEDNEENVVVKVEEEPQPTVNEKVCTSHFTKEQLRDNLEAVRRFKLENCDRCVGCIETQPPGFPPRPTTTCYEDRGFVVHCPLGEKFRRDPPDGGCYN